MLPAVTPSSPPAPRLPRIARLAPLVVPLAGGLLAAGCYRYVPAPSLAPPAGASVRLHLTPEGMAALEPRLGPGTATVVGQVRDAGAGGVTLDVSETRKAYGGAPVRWIGEQVTIPTGTIAHAERRTLARGRTAVAAVTAVLGAAVALVVLIAQGGGGTDEAPGGGPGPTP